MLIFSDIFQADIDYRIFLPALALLSLLITAAFDRPGLAFDTQHQNEFSSIYTFIIESIR